MLLLSFLLLLFLPSPLLIFCGSVLLVVLLLNFIVVTSLDDIYIHIHYHRMSDERVFVIIVTLNDQAG